MGFPQDRDTSQSGYYSEDSDFNSISMTSVTTSGASTPMERQTKGNFDRCINHKVTLAKLNDESSMNDRWIWLTDVCRYIDSGCSLSILESKINKSLLKGFWGVWFRMNQMLDDSRSSPQQDDDDRPTSAQQRVVTGILCDDSKNQQTHRQVCRAS